MSKRDVELIIRAKNEASGAVDGVAKSLAELQERQDVLRTSAKKTDSTLGELADELDKLRVAAGAMAALDKLRGSVSAAGDAFSRQAADLQRTKAAYDELAADQRQAAAAAEPLRRQVEESAKALAAERAAVDAARAARTKAAQQAAKDAKLQATAERQLAAAREYLAAKPDSPARLARVTEKEAGLAERRKNAEASAAAEKTLTEAYERQAAALALNAAEHREAAGTLKALEQTLGTLASRLTTTGAAVAQNTAQLNAAESEYAQLSAVVDRAQGEFIAAAAAQNIQAQSAAQAAVQVAVLSARMRELQNSQRGQRGAVKLVDPDSLRDTIRGLRDARDAVDDAVQGTGGLRQLGQAVEQLARSGRNLGRLGESLKQQEAKVDSAQRAWAEAQAEVKRLAGAMRDAGTPSEQLAAAFGKAQGQARAAKTAFQEERAAATQMASAFQQAGVGAGTLASAQAALSAQATVNAAALERGRNALVSYQGPAERVSGSSRKAAAGIREIGQAAQQTGRGLNALAASMFNLNNETRTALSFGQRIRGQVLGLAAAAGGVYAVQSAVAGVVQASMDMEAVQSRLAVGFQGDQTKVAEALAFTRQTADELGLSFRTLALQYSKLTAASQGTNLEGDKTAKIFYSVSEAARVLRLSDEEVQGVFKAITDIMSKGAIQAEELKGQLGDRIPAAVSMMAEAVGVGTAELMKMMEAGALTSDYLEQFAEVLSKRMGAGKQAAVKSASAEFGRLNNALLEVQLTVANSGFLKELADGAGDLAEALKDPAVQDGFRQLGKAMGDFVASAADFLPYTDSIITLLKTLGVILATKIGVGLLQDAIGGFRGVAKAYGHLEKAYGSLNAASKAAGGGVRGLLTVLRGAAGALGVWGAAAATIYVVGDAAYDAYQEVARLDKFRDESARREKKALREFVEINRALEESLSQTQEGYKAGVRSQEDYIRSTEELMKMTKAEIDLYQKGLLARMKLVGEQRTQEMAKPRNEQNVALLVELDAKERALAQAIERSVGWEKARAWELRNTAAAVKEVSTSLEQAFADADSLRTRMEAVARSNFDNTVLALERVRDARVAALTLNGADESLILQANTDFESKKLQVIRQYSQRQYDIIRQTEEQKKTLLDRAGLDAGKRAESLTEIEKEASQARVQIAQQEAQAVASAREQALGRYMAALQRVADLDRRIADIRLNGEFQVADIRRSAMGDLEAYRSREAELAKLSGRIQQEIGKGNLEVAEALAQRQLSLAQALNTEVKEGEKVVVSKEQAAAKAVAGTQRANENLIAVMTRRKEIAQKEAEEQRRLYENLTTALEKLNVTLARVSGATTIDIPLSIEDQKVQNEIDRVQNEIRGKIMANKIGVPITADTREYVQKFQSDVLSPAGHKVQVGVFLDDEMYKIKVNEIRGDTITATARVEFSGPDLEEAVARAKQIVEGDFPKMQIALDSEKTYAEFQALSLDVKQKLSQESFLVTAQFGADTKPLDLLLQKYSTDVTTAPVTFNPDTTAADQARAAISQPIVVPIQYQPTGNIPRRARGGVIDIPGFASGGSPGGYIRGPGSTTSDSILAAVSNKEYVVKALAVRKYGLPFMNALNAGTLDMDRVKSAMGESKGVGSTAGGNGESMTVNLTINGQQIGGLSGSRSSVMGLVDALHEVARQTGG